jgi:hypothetical protein
MLETYSLEELRPLAGHEVVDANGESVGYIDLVFYDDATERPEWMGIWSGIAGKGHRVLVPIRGVEHVEDEIRVPWTKDVIQSAPTYDEEDDTGVFLRDPAVVGISPEKERAAYEHYGVDPLSPRPDGPPVARFRAWRVEVRTTERPI